MIKYSVMYPAKAGARFDMNYYRHKHMQLVRDIMMPHGLLKTSIDKGVPGPDGAAAPYICVGSLYFKSMQDYANASTAAGSKLRDDIKNYTDVTPVRQFAEIVEE